MYNMITPYTALHFISNQREVHIQLATVAYRESVDSDLAPRGPSYQANK